MPGVLVFPVLQFLLCWVLLSLLSLLCPGLGLPGLRAIFSLHLDRFSLASTYNECGILSLKSKVC